MNSRQNSIRDLPLALSVLLLIGFFPYPSWAGEKLEISGDWTITFYARQTRQISSIEGPDQTISENLKVSIDEKRFEISDGKNSEIFHIAGYKINKDGSGEIDLAQNIALEEVSLKGIFRLKGNKLMVRLAMNVDHPRPTNFSVKYKQSGLLFSAMKSEK